MTLRETPAILAAAPRAALFSNGPDNAKHLLDRRTEEEKQEFIALKRRKLEIELASTERGLLNLERERSVLEDAKQWFSGASKSFRFETPQNSSLHKLMASFDDIFVYSSKPNAAAKIVWAERSVLMAQAFVIQHDWGSVFEKSDLLGGEIILPANPSAFEFQISGRRVIFLMGAGYEEMEGGLFLQTDSGWWLEMLADIDTTDISDITNKIRGACIALDAEIAETNIVRAPHRLNAKREARGKLPINDYHVVSLLRKSRAPALEPSGDDRHSPRLHFRRGHWRHYHEHKTWIRWTLAGDPDLGFIDKEYRL